MTLLHCDFETRSPLDLRKVGLHRYARHPDTDIWCLAVGFDDEEPTLCAPNNWSMTQQDRMFAHVQGGGTVVAHNAPFELEIWNQIMVPRYGWPELKPEQMFCTMAQCYAMALPGALDDAALTLGLHVLKDTEGRSIMLKFARPWKIDEDGTIHWMDECPKFTVNGQEMTGQQGLARLLAYCQQDVRVERELGKRLLPLSEKERKVWLLDYAINQRGVAVDIEAAKAAMAMAETVKERCSAELTEITGGAVQSITAVAALKEWIAEQGVSVGSLAKQDVVDILDTDLPDPVHRALTLRQEAGKASTAKLDRMVDAAGTDSRLRNLYQYHGAATGRWAGRGVQVHNLPRDMPARDTVEQILSLVRSGSYEAIDAVFGPPLTMISKCLRSFFVAPPGKVLVSGDWSNVEGRGQAWFAGEQWKLDAFRKADAKEGPGIYELAYSRMFGVPVESVLDPSEERQVGKVSELAFGYQGGKGSFAKMGKNYGVKVAPEKAEEFKEAWRDAHPAIAGVRMRGVKEDDTVFWYRKGGVWKAIQNAAIDAVLNPGTKYTCGAPGREATFKTAGSFLWCQLPSGRVICYPYPKVLQDEYGQQLTYMTVPGPETAVIHDVKNASNWARVSTYGGSLFNNIVQGFCRDFLADCMLALSDAGAAVVIHTHDDINIEVAAERAEGARAGMEGFMRTPPAWAKDFPLFAKCKILTRYGK